MEKPFYFPSVLRRLYSVSLHFLLFTCTSRCGVHRHMKMMEDNGFCMNKKSQNKEENFFGPLPIWMAIRMASVVFADNHIEPIYHLRSQ